MKNNVLSYPSDDPTFKVKSQRVARLLEDRIDEKGRYLLNKPEFRLLFGDSYFLHYSLIPLLRKKNDNEFLNSVLRAMKEYVGSEDFEKLHEKTRWSDLLSTVFAVSFSEEFIKQRQQNPNDNVSKQAENAIQKAGRVTEIVSSMLEDGIKAGDAPDDLRRLLDLANKIVRVNLGEEIFKMAGKILFRLSQFFNYKKSYVKCGRISGIRKSHNLFDAMPQELALPDELFEAKLINGFLSWVHVNKSIGNFIVLVDKSGSMDTEKKTVWSRSVALAIYKVAQKIKNAMAFSFFDAKVHGFSLDLQKIVEDILTVNCGGGTDIDEALSKAVDFVDVNGWQGSTILLITDGEDDVTFPEDELHIRRLKLVSVMIDGRNDTLAEISNSYLKVEPDVDGALKIIGELI